MFLTREGREKGSPIRKAVLVCSLLKEVYVSFMIGEANPINLDARHVLARELQDAVSGQRN